MSNRPDIGPLNVTEGDSTGGFSLFPPSSGVVTIEAPELFATQSNAPEEAFSVTGPASPVREKLHSRFVLQPLTESVTSAIAREGRKHNARANLIISLNS